jgi:protein-tyrosine phosphatase
MLPTIYKVFEIGKGTLSVMAKPVSGEWIEDEFSGLRKLGVGKVISLLERDEEIEVGLQAEIELCHKNDLDFCSFPIPDRGLPQTEAAKVLIEATLHEIQSGMHVVIHCRAGIGRTGIIAGAILVVSGMEAKQALALISTARGVQVPDTEEQIEWLMSYGK